MTSLNFKTSKGFSLVELLVVISIIGIVSGVGLVSISTIQKNTRDAQRITDLRQIQSALQSYYADNNFYPQALTLTDGDEFNSCYGLPEPCDEKTYIQNLPKDPMEGVSTPYCYKSRQTSSETIADCDLVLNPGKCHFYTLCATLENPSDAQSCSCGGSSGGNFKITPL